LCPRRIHDELISYIYRLSWTWAARRRQPPATSDHLASRKTVPPQAATKLTRAEIENRPSIGWLGGRNRDDKTSRFLFGATQQRQSPQRHGLHSQCLMYSITNLLSYTPPGYNVLSVAPALAPVISDTPKRPATRASEFLRGFGMSFSDPSTGRSIAQWTTGIVPLVSLSGNLLHTARAKGWGSGYLPQLSEDSTPACPNSRLHKTRVARRSRRHRCGNDSSRTRSGFDQNNRSRTALMPSDHRQSSRWQMSTLSRRYGTAACVDNARLSRVRR